MCGLKSKERKEQCFVDVSVVLFYSCCMWTGSCFTREKIRCEDVKFLKALTQVVTELGLEPRSGDSTFCTPASGSVPGPVLFVCLSIGLHKIP